MRSLQNFIQDKLHEDLSYIYQDINESGGLYKGQIELASFLCDDFEKYINNNAKEREFKLEYDNINNFDNVFFENLLIHYHIDIYRKTVRGDSSFFNSKDTNNIDYNYNSATEKLNFIKIELYVPSNINDIVLDDLRARICHELNHCYSYYQIIKDDIKEDIYNIKVPNEYKNILSEWYDKSYTKIVKDIDNYNDIAKRWSSLLIYTLTRYERNAFLAEIDSYLFDRRGEKLRNVNNAENELSKCNQYNIYNIENFKVIDIIKNEWNKEQQNILKDLYNNIYNTNLSFKRIIYLLKYKNEKTIEKLNDNIKTIIREYKNIKEDTKSPVYEGYINYFESPMHKYLNLF